MEIETLTTACKEKDQQLQEVQQSLSKFKRVSTAVCHAITRRRIMYVHVDCEFFTSQYQVMRRTDNNSA